MMSRAKRQSTPASRKSSGCRFDHSVLRVLQESDNLLSRHRREAFEKVIDRFAYLTVVKQRLHWDFVPGNTTGPPVTSGLRETIGCFVASDYVSKCAAHNNRHVVAAQKGRFRLPLYLRAADGFPISVCPELLGALHRFCNKTGNRWTPVDILGSDFQSQSKKFKYLDRNAIFYH